MRVKTYDFRAFCRGELIRTNQSMIFWRILEHLQSPVTVVSHENGDVMIVYAHPYGFFSQTFVGPYFVTTPAEADARRLA